MVIIVETDEPEVYQAVLRFNSAEAIGPSVSLPKLADVSVPTGDPTESMMMEPRLGVLT